jgi:N-acetyl-D-muramate 6-phosphate phosphatase
MADMSCAVLFDLDGTLVDSAPDLGAAANLLRERRNLPPLPLAHYRPMTGTGARGMLGVALQVTPEDAAFAALRDEFLDLYEARLSVDTCVFPAMVPVLARLDAIGLPWGIVTNKHRRFAEPLVSALSLGERSGALVCGDTTPHAKPHPAPLLEGARRLGIDPVQCYYVGDDLRDIVAGRAAGMRTVAAAWGYLGQGEPIEDWGADHLIDCPAHLLKLLALA